MGAGEASIVNLTGTRSFWRLRCGGQAVTGLSRRSARLRGVCYCAGPFIDDVAPPEQKTLWFGILFLVRRRLAYVLCSSGARIVTAPAGFINQAQLVLPARQWLRWAACGSLAPWMLSATSSWLGSRGLARAAETPCLLAQFPTLGIAAGCEALPPPGLPVHAAEQSRSHPRLGRRYIFGGILGLALGWRWPFYLQVRPCSRERQSWDHASCSGCAAHVQC